MTGVAAMTDTAEQQPTPPSQLAATASASDDSDSDMERELFGLTSGGLAGAGGVEEEEEEDEAEGYRWLERLVAESAGVSMLLVF